MKFSDCTIAAKFFWSNNMNLQKTHATKNIVTLVEIYVFKTAKTCRFVCHLLCFGPRIVPMARVRAIAFCRVMIRNNVFEFVVLSKLNYAIRIVRTKQPIWHLRFMMT